MCPRVHQFFATCIPVIGSTSHASMQKRPAASFAGDEIRAGATNRWH
jgi:hypothetical protein